MFAKSGVHTVNASQDLTVDNEPRSRSSSKTEEFEEKIRNKIDTMVTDELMTKDAELRKSYTQDLNQTIDT